MQDDVRGYNPELGEVRQERDVPEPNFRELLDDVLLALQIPELLIQLRGTRVTDEKAQGESKGWLEPLRRCQRRHPVNSG